MVPLYTSKTDTGNQGGEEMDCFWQSFAGGGSPQSDCSFEEFEFPKSHLLIYHKKTASIEFKSYVSLSISCFDS